MLTFQVSSDAPNEANNTAHLKADNWDDFGYETKFSLTVFNEKGNKFEIGDVKIGFVGQKERNTIEEMPDTFQKLDQKFFSLGQDTDYYQKIINLPEEMQSSLLTALGDIVHNPTLLQTIQSEDVFKISLLRTVHLTSIGQFKRILLGEAPLTNYNFYYERAGNEYRPAIQIDFKVEANSKPSSNIHILIGRNGVGKTTLLNNMVKALLPNQEDIEQTNSFFTISKQLFQSELIPLPNNYFAGIISVSFSAFDIFTPPNEQSDVKTGTCYDYVGLKKRIPQEGGSDLWGLKDKGDLCEDFTESLSICLSLTAKRKRWKKAITTLESDSNFSDMNLCQLMDVDDELSLKQKAKSLFERMSSGHAIVLLTITKLVET